MVFFMYAWNKYSGALTFWCCFIFHFPLSIRISAPHSLPQVENRGVYFCRDAGEGWKAWGAGDMSGLQSVTQLWGPVCVIHQILKYYYLRLRELLPCATKPILVTFTGRSAAIFLLFSFEDWRSHRRVTQDTEGRDMVSGLATVLGKLWVDSLEVVHLLGFALSDPE